MTKNSKMNASFGFVPIKTTNSHILEDKNKKIYIIILPQIQK